MFRSIIAVTFMAVLTVAALAPVADAVLKYKIVSVAWDTTHAAPGAGVQGGSSVRIQAFYWETTIPADTFWWSVEFPLNWSVTQMRTALDERGQALRNARLRSDSLKAYEGTTVNVP